MPGPFPLLSPPTTIPMTDPTNQSYASHLIVRPNCAKASALQPSHHPVPPCHCKQPHSKLHRQITIGLSFIFLRSPPTMHQLHKIQSTARSNLHPTLQSLPSIQHYQLTTFQTSQHTPALPTQKPSTAPTTPHSDPSNGHPYIQQKSTNRMQPSAPQAISPATTHQSPLTAPPHQTMTPLTLHASPNTRKARSPLPWTCQDPKAHPTPSSPQIPTCSQP